MENPYELKQCLVGCKRVHPRIKISGSELVDGVVPLDVSPDHPTVRKSQPASATDLLNVGCNFVAVHSALNNT